MPEWFLTMLEWLLAAAFIIGMIVYGRQRIAAKNDEIRAKEAEIQQLKTQIDFLEKRRPKALEEDHQSTMRMYEDLVERLDHQGAERSAEIKRLEGESQEKDAKLLQSSQSIQVLQDRVATLKAELESGALPSTGTVFDSLASSAVVATATGTPRPVSDEDVKVLIESTASAGTVIKSPTKSKIIKPPS